MLATHTMCIQLCRRCDMCESTVIDVAETRFSVKCVYCDKEIKLVSNSTRCPHCGRPAGSMSWSLYKDIENIKTTITSGERILPNLSHIQKTITK